MNEFSKLVDNTLTEARIKSTITSIRNYAFYGCSNLTAVHIENTSQLPSISWDTFNGCASLYFYVPTGTVATMRSNANSNNVWRVYADRIFEYQVPYWYEQSYTCELDENQELTRNVISVQLDTNPSSPTYNTTRTVTQKDNRCATGFTKITSLSEATTGTYLIVNTSVNKALNASLIKSTTATGNGINASGNMIDVTIEDDVIEQTETTLNAAAYYDAENKTLSWTDENSGTTYYLYWSGSGARFAYTNNTLPSQQYPMVATYYQNYGSYAFANNTRLIGYNTASPRINFYIPNNNTIYENNMALFKLS